MSVERKLKKVLVIRLGALGDSIIITPVLRKLKEDGWHVTVSTKLRGRQILQNNPFIDEIMPHNEKLPPNMEVLNEYWKGISKGFDKVINFTGTIENRLATTNGYIGLIGTKEDLSERHEKCNINFYDYSLKHAGYPDVKGKNGELFFSNSEMKWVRNFRQKHKDKFMIVWALSGSSLHKVYPYQEIVAKEFMDKYGHNSMIVNVGDNMEKLLEFYTIRNVIRTSGEWSVRRTLSVLQVADLVIGPDTGVMHGAGCFDVPKILLLSANTEENLSKYWENCINITADDCYCYPCHRLTKLSELECPAEEDYGNESMFGRVPICMSRIKMSDVLKAIETVYINWTGGERCTYLKQKERSGRKTISGGSLVLTA